MAIYKIFRTDRQEKLDSTKTTRTTTIVRDEVHSYNDTKTLEEVTKVFDDMVKELMPLKDGTIELRLCEVKTTDSDIIYNNTLKVAYEPHTEEEIREFAYSLEGIMLDGEYLNVFCVNDEVHGYDEEVGEGLTVYYIDDMCIYDKFVSFEELANRTDVAFYTTELA